MWGGGARKKPKQQKRSKQKMHAGKIIRLIGCRPPITI